MSNPSIDLAALQAYFVGLQQRIVDALETVDGQAFRSDAWQRDEGGGGRSCVLENGGVFERAGVNFSHVHGANLPPAASAARPAISGRQFEAMGVSLVLHPRNPHCPTVHLNVRCFCAFAPESRSGPAEAEPAGSGPAEAIWWFGGGMDLTPYYGQAEDARHFHRQCKAALDPFGAEYYARFKRWCDEYFYLRHRAEARGVGGIFFDDLADRDFAFSFALTRAVGDRFLEAYLPILDRRRTQPYGERERAFQAYRRGRYVEFNLVYDRGTLFGLQSGGRTESILMSLPPQVSWRYDWQPQAGTEEARLYTDFLPARDWI